MNDKGPDATLLPPRAGTGRGEELGNGRQRGGSQGPGLGGGRGKGSSGGNRMWLVEGGEELCPKPGERCPAPPSCCSLP